MTTFYISPTGSDAAAGTSEATAWQSISFLNTKLADSTVTQGDVVLFQRNAAEQFGAIAPLTTYSATGDFLTFGAYGKPGQYRRPRITTYKLLNTSASWALHSAGVYKIDLSNPATHGGYTVANTNIGHLLINGTTVYGNRVWNLADLASPWDFYCDATYLYVKAAADPTTLATDIRAAPEKTPCVLTTSTKYVGLEVYGGGGANGIGYDQPGGTLVVSHTRVFDCELHHLGGCKNASATTIGDDGNTYPQRYGNGFTARIGSSDQLFERNVLHDIFDSPISVEGPTSGGDIAWHEIAYRGNLSYRNGNGIAFWGSGTPGVSAGFFNVVAEDNLELFTGYSWGYASRPDKKAGVGLLTYNWDLGADIKFRRNVIYAPRNGYIAEGGVQHQPGLTRSDNDVFLYAGTLIMRRHGSGIGAGAAYTTPIEQAATWVANQANDLDTRFYVLPGSTPTDVASALTQIGADTGSAISRAKAIEQTVAAVRGDLEVLRESMRVANALNLIARTATGAGQPLSMKRLGDANSRFAVEDDGDIRLGDGSTTDIRIWRNAAFQLFVDSEIKTFKNAVGTHFSATISGEAATRFSVNTQGAAGSAGATRINLGGGSSAVDVNLYWQGTDILATDDDFAIRLAGKGLQVKEGSNAKQGIATLVAGAATVANTAVTANSRIQLTIQSLGTVTAPKAIGVTARVAGTSFTITSADATDTSVIAYEIFEPAP